MWEKSQEEGRGGWVERGGSSKKTLYKRRINNPHSLNPFLQLSHLFHCWLKLRFVGMEVRIAWEVYWVYDTAMFVFVCLCSSAVLRLDSSSALWDLFISPWQTELCLKYFEIFHFYGMAPGTWEMVARAYYLIEAMLWWELGARGLSHWQFTVQNNLVKGIKYLPRCLDCSWGCITCTE